MGSFGKKTANPGYIPGDHWVTCDVCGFVVRSSAAKTRWDGLVVCPEDWEVRHPQDFLRGREDDMTAKGLIRPDYATEDGVTTVVDADTRVYYNSDKIIIYTGARTATRYVDISTAGFNDGQTVQIINNTSGQQLDFRSVNDNNILFYTEDFSQWDAFNAPVLGVNDESWRGSAVVDSIEDNNAGALAYLRDTVYDGTLDLDNLHTYSGAVSIKKDTTATANAAVQNYFINGTDDVAYQIEVNPATGAAYHWPSGVGVYGDPEDYSVAEDPYDSNYWRLYYTIKNTGGIRLYTYLYPAFSTTFGLPDATLTQKTVFAGPQLSPGLILPDYETRTSTQEITGSATTMFSATETGRVVLEKYNGSWRIKSKELF